MKKPDQNTHQNAPFFKIFIPMNPFAMHSMRLRDMHSDIYLKKNYLHPSVKSCKICAFVAF